MKKLTKIWGVGLTLVLVASMLLAAAPAAAGELSWSTQTIPSTSGLRLASGSAVTDMAVSADGQTIWVVDASANATYKSTNGGETWSTKTVHANVTQPLLVAMAPDDPDIVAIVADTNAVYVTINGGSTAFGDLGTVKEGTSGETVNSLADIAISQDDSGTHYVAVCGIDSDPNANVWYFNVGAAAPAWVDIEDAGTPAFGPSGAVTEAAIALAFSPNFASDKVLAVVTVEDDAGNSTEGAYLELYSFSSSNWNDTDAKFTGYPVQICDNGASGGYGAGSAGAISLAPDYLGGDDSLRLAFVGLNMTTVNADDGIYRLTDTSINEMSLNKDIFSIAYDGTNLVAGDSDAHRVYRCADPLVSSPTVSTSADLKSPGGAAATQVTVAWAGSDVVAGTIGTSSSFDVSTDNGKSFNGLSLVDAATLRPHDVAVTPDGTIYLSADDNADLSLWRYASRWERVLAINVTDCFVRIAPDDPDTIYVVDAATDDIWYSSAGGDTKWFARTMKASIQDMAVESASVVYAAESSSKSVYKSTNGGFTWKSAKTAACDNNIHTIKSLGEDKVIVGDTGGDVSYSTDGYSTWTSVGLAYGSGDLVQVTASGLASGDFIYVGTDDEGDNILRWEIGSSTTWSDIITSTITFDLSANGSATDTAGVYGLELVDGVLYALLHDTTGPNGGFMRILSPSTAGSSTTWSVEGSAAESFNATPSALRTSPGSTKLWALDPTAYALFTYTDTIAAVGPTLVGPADGTEIQVNPVSGYTFSVSLSWERPSKATSYDVEVSLDDAFKEDVVNETVASTSSIAAHVEAGSTFMPNTTYYWRVRCDSGGPLYSPYSETRSFSIGSLPDVTPVVVQAPPPAPIITPEIVIPTPEIVLPAPIVNIPAPQEVIIPPAPAPAPAVPTVAIYAIIIIGALLVIALIVLIMRTRRPI